MDFYEFLHFLKAENNQITKNSEALKLQKMKLLVLLDS